MSNKICSKGEGEAERGRKSSQIRGEREGAFQREGHGYKGD